MDFEYRHLKQRQGSNQYTLNFKFKQKQKDKVIFKLYIGSSLIAQKQFAMEQDQGNVTFNCDELQKTIKVYCYHQNNRQKTQHFIIKKNQVTSQNEFVVPDCDFGKIESRGESSQVRNNVLLLLFVFLLLLFITNFSKETLA